MRTSQEPLDDLTSSADPQILPGQDSFGLMLRLSMSGMRRAFKEQLAEYGIPWSVWYYLRVLWETDGLSQKELVTRVGMMQPNAVCSIQLLKKLGLVEIERAPADRRRTCIWLTPRAQELKEQLLPRVRERAERVAFKGLSAEERKQLMALLGRVCANIVQQTGP